MTDIFLQERFRRTLLNGFGALRSPQEPAQTRGSRPKKANPEGLVFPLLVEAATTECKLQPYVFIKLINLITILYAQLYAYSSGLKCKLSLSVALN